MDEGLLNDLLECSVCLERLDTSSRVLPCQHTFCLKCLKVIVESHKELRCPECRVLVDARVEELPPNVLLMRILDSVTSRRAQPRRAAQAHARPRGSQLQQATSQASPQPASLPTCARADSKPLPPHARAIHDYQGKEAGDLSFKKGETVLLQKRLDPFWYHGECGGRSGVFPITFVQMVVPLPVPTALCKALYDFRMSAPDEEGCLAFDKGAIITVHRRVDENWAEGRIEQRVGIFPIAFVELNQPARQLMQSPTVTRPVPPTPDQVRAGHSDHRHHTQHTHRYQPMSMSTPANAGQGNYQNVAAMSQSHPNFHQHAPMLAPHSQILVPQSVTHGLVTTTAVPRNILEPTNTKHLELIHATNIHNKSSHSTVGLQSVSRIDGFGLRNVKFDSYNSTPVHQKAETTYQNVRVPATVANFNNQNSSDSSSSVNTPSVGVSSTTTPNSSSNTSSCESAEPSVPSSPDNNTERNKTVTQANPVQNTTVTEDEETQDLNSSMGVLSLNESSTATNTSLNVSLPAEATVNDTSQSEPSLLDVPSSSKAQNPVRSGPESLLTFGLGLQAALSPSHGKDGSYLSRSHREHAHREKRHSLTPGSHLGGSQHSSQNRHSAEILATSLLDHVPERDRQSSSRERERDRRRRPLPAAYIALYPYKPQKPDELELRKGGVYTVTERCRDGWFKGRSERTRRAGVFPGNYVVPHPTANQTVTVPTSQSGQTSQNSQSSQARHEHVQDPPAASPAPSAPAPLAPPRAPSPPASTGLAGQEKAKDKSKTEKSSISSGVSLMKRLAAMKKCKSPPPSYSMDNPVFEHTPATVAATTNHHVRSGSCPSQLLGTLGGSASARLRHRERPTVLPQRQDRPTDSPWQSQHRKSQSLDVTAARRDRDRHHTQPVKERFRCVVPYPPNSEYELELRVDDIVMVHRKRGDGWYKGTLQRTGRTGLFPASFVQSCPE